MNALVADLSRLFDSALAAHRSGDVQLASRVYRQILDDHPEQPDALNLLAMIAMESAHFQEAADYLRRAIASSSEVPQFHCHLGHALQGVGDFEAAAAAYRQAIRVRADYAEAHSSLGFALSRLGRLAEAVASCRAALAIDADYFYALNNLGDALREQGDLDAAARAYRRAMQVEPGIAALHTKLGAVLRDQGRGPEALEQLWAAIDGGDREPASYRLLGSVLRFSQPLRYDQALDGRLLAFFSAPEVDHGDAAQFATALIKLKYGARLGAGHGSDPRFAIDTLLADPLVCALLTRTVNADPQLELVLTSARRRLLLGEAAAGEAVMPAISVLAQQSFINEYVLSVGDDERVRLDALGRDLESPDNWRGAPGIDTQMALLQFAMYQPLSSLDTATRLAQVPLAQWHACLRPVVKRSLLDFMDERALEAEIPLVGQVRDRVSRAVKRQYEENPYPRWLMPAYRNPGNVYGILAGTLRSFQPPEMLKDEIKVLVVGCGTGHHPISIALRYDNAQVLATDLSRRSLAYGLRMARELGVSNVRFVENDLFELAELEGEFHIIECVGVLHHTHSITAGVRSLLGKLHPDGLVKIGLYSARARAPVIAARQRIAALGLTPAADDIRRFRQMALHADDDRVLADLVEFGDFYTLSNCRDLLFHVHEQNLTLGVIGELLMETGLRFLGFESADAGLAEDYRRRFPEDTAMNDLSRWELVEADNPGAFTGLYQCWCARKPGFSS